MPKEGMPHANKACKKMYNPYPWKIIIINERDDSWQGISHIINHSISIHTHADLDHTCMIWFLHGFAFYFTIYEVQVCPIFYPTLELHKSPLVGKEKGTLVLVRIYTLSDSRESFEELCLYFLKTFLRKTLSGSMHCSNSQQLKTRRRLKAPWMSMG